MRMGMRMVVGVGMIVGMIMIGVVQGAKCQVLGARCRVPGASCRVQGARAECRVLVLGTDCVVFVHDELRGGDAGAQDTLRTDVVAGHREAPERARQLVDRQTRINERAEQHVARDPREAVEIQNS